MKQRWLQNAAPANRGASVTAELFAVMAAIGALLKAVGPSSAAGAVFAAVGVGGALSAAGFAVLRAHAERVEAQRTTLRAAGARPLRVAEALAGNGMYALGVEQEAPEALMDLGLPPDGHAPYLPRPVVDEALRRRLVAAAAISGVTMVVLAERSKTGKSRTMFVVGRCLASHSPAASTAILASSARRVCGRARVWDREAP